MFDQVQSEFPPPLQLWRLTTTEIIGKVSEYRKKVHVDKAPLKYMYLWIQAWPSHKCLLPLLQLLGPVFEEPLLWLSCWKKHNKKQRITILVKTYYWMSATFNNCNVAEDIYFDKTANLFFQKQMQARIILTTNYAKKPNDYHE